mmetsp:Transcript_57209/g.170570  ORF Transcript_57209/g.170570 Transcript_57209/m.170570 type:complete len:92 (-) Transcript_57209:91-366(-)
MSRMRKTWAWRDQTGAHIGAKSECMPAARRLDSEHNLSIQEATHSIIFHSDRPILKSKLVPKKVWQSKAVKPLDASNIIYVVTKFIARYDH